MEEIPQDKTSCHLPTRNREGKTEYLLIGFLLSFYMVNMDIDSCPKCNGQIDGKTGRCLTCGYSSHSAQQRTRASSRSSVLGRSIMLISVLGGLVGLALNWAVYGERTHSGYEIITGGISALIGNIEFIDPSSIASIDLTRLFLICFGIFCLITLVLNLLPWKRIRVAISTVLLLLFLTMDFFLLVLLNSIPMATSADMIYLGGKGYHVSIFSLFFGSMGALVNLFIPSLPKY